jgi:hypothetical protein
MGNSDSMIWPGQDMKPRTNFKLALYKPTRITLSLFALFSFGMGAYAYLNEIGSISQVVQAVAFGVIALIIRLTVFRKPVVTLSHSDEKGTDDSAPS